MITTTSMRQLFAAILDEDREAVTEALLETGVIHFLDIRELSGEWVSSLKEHHPEEAEEKVGELRRRIESYFRSADVEPSRYVRMEDAFGHEPRPEDAEEQIEELASKIRKTRERQREAQEEILRLNELQRRIPKHGILSSEVSGEHSYIRVRFGTVPDSQVEDFERALSDFPTVYIRGEGAESERVDFLLSLRRDEERISEICRKYDWRERKPSEESTDRNEAVEKDLGEKALADYSGEEIRNKIENLQRRQKELEKEAEEIVHERADRLSMVWAGLRIRELSAKIERFYRKTDRTFLILGWVPKEKCEEVTESIKRVCRERCRVEWHDPADEGDPEVSASVPVHIENPKPLRPFQKLVENYAVPAYGTIDPTPFVAVFYLAMFGLMFGDFGHGAVVSFVGLLGTRTSRKKGKETMLFPLLIWCGGAAMLAGVLFGSYFGMGWFPPLWFDYHGIVMGHGGAGHIQSITDILLVTIYFGITVITVGLLLNWINRIRRRDWFGLVWENGGLLVGWLYAAGTYTAFYFVEREYRGLPDSSALFLLLGLPVIILAAKPYLEHRRHVDKSAGKPPKPNPIDLIMSWLVEILEIFSGYLSNTLSFMRVAGLGIAHVSLMIAFFQIADMAAGEGGYSIWSFLILIAGNALVIGLEGLSAGIQALRLNYYEFFSKYFSGTGKAYVPISLRE